MFGEERYDLSQNPNSLRFLIDDYVRASKEIQEAKHKLAIAKIGIISTQALLDNGGFVEIESANDRNLLKIITPGTGRGFEERFSFIGRSLQLDEECQTLRLYSDRQPSDTSEFFVLESSGPHYSVTQARRREVHV